METLNSKEYSRHENNPLTYATVQSKAEHMISL